VIVVEFMNVFVNGRVMEATMDPIEIKVLNDERTEDHQDILLPGRKRQLHAHTKKDEYVVANEHERKLDEHVSEDKALKAVPLLLWRELLRKLKFIFLKP
jgi:hypothetical protein